MTATVQSSKEQRIEQLFLTGYSLDLIAERGMSAGWTRADVQHVVNEQGWELDASGRLPRDLRAATPPPRIDPMPPPSKPVEELMQPARRAIPVHTTAGAATVAVTAPAGPLPRWAAVLIEARNHPVARIKRQAERIDSLLEQLVAALGEADEERKVRERLAELDAERERLRAQLRKKTAAVPVAASASSGEGKEKPRKPINHGTWGGWQAHTARGEDPCDDCERGKDQHMAAMRARQGTKA